MFGWKSNIFSDLPSCEFSADKMKTLLVLGNSEKHGKVMFSHFFLCNHLYQKANLILKFY